MSKLIWDKTGERSYESGVDHGVLYPGAVGGTYENGVVWNGLTGVTESPSGADATDFWADNIKYASMRAAEAFGYTIEAYAYPDEFAVCDGSEEVVAGVKIGQQSRKSFGFSYRTMKGNDADANAGYLIHIIWNSTASPSERAYQTINDSPDAITFSWECEATPVNVTGYKPTCLMTIDSQKIDSDKLTALENKLYGTDSQEATLPTPDEVIALIR